MLRLNTSYFENIIKMINFKENMKYLVNFQIEIIVNGSMKKKIRTTHTILENEIEKNLVDDFDMMKEWFIKYFYNNSLDNFVDVPKYDEKYNVQIKVGRITNAINGKYKTF
ncbi:MAG: hypothetical protein CMI77_00515 [Candidatus Pelagibacter sp.]|nr:hypothetical protein [Candidatus Pelagibacter sp.]